MARSAAFSKMAKKKFRINDRTEISRENHEKLLQFLKDLLEFGNIDRKNRIKRLELIDRQLAGYIELDSRDRKRQLDNMKGKSPKPVDIRIQLTQTKLEDEVTYLLGVFAPDDQMYNAISTKNKQWIANGFAAEHNKQARDFHHYTQLQKTLNGALKYNIAGTIIDWERHYGNRLKGTDGGGTEVAYEVVREGNCLSSIDFYNFIYDIAVHPLKLHSHGQFFATIEITNTHSLRKMESDKEIFNLDVLLNEDNMPIQGSYPLLKYYEPHPNIVGSLDLTRNSQVDFVNVLTMGSERAGIKNVFERVNMRVWVSPKKFGLGNNDKMEVWRFTLIGDELVLEGQRLNNAHGMLPCAITMPREDEFVLQTRSYAEQMLPLETFASHEINVHQRASRKKLYGVTIYDSNALPLMDKADLQGGTIPFKPTGVDRDVRKSVLQLNDAPDTNQTMENIARILELMERFLPTDLAQQVANLDRATLYQAAATVMSKDRRNHKIARTIDDQHNSVVRFQMMYNTIEKRGSIKAINDTNGEEEDIDPKQFFEAGIEHDIGSGLKGIDRLIVIEFTKELIGLVIQNAQAIQSVDWIQWVDWLYNVMGEKFDFNQFRFEEPFDALPPEAKQQAFELLQTAVQQQGGGEQPGAPGQLTALPGGQNG